MTELKPCPLCGEPAKLDRYSPFRHYKTGEPLDQVSVYCTSCSLSLSWYPGDLGLDRDQMVEFVTEQWDHRPRATTPSPLADRLEELAAKATPGPIAVNPFSAYIDCTQLDDDGDPTPIAALAWPTSYRSEAETKANGQLWCELRNALPTIIAALRSQS